MPIRFALLFALMAGLAPAGSQTFTIRPTAGGRFALTVEKTGLMSGKKHLFLFERYKGRLTYDAEAPERSRVELAIDAASAVCKDTWVSEKDLKKIQEYALKDMLDAARYPELLFISTGITRKDGGSYLVEGMLTVRGVAKPASVTVTLDRDAGAISSVSGHSVIRIRDYGLKPPGAALGAIGTRNEMVVEFRLEPASYMQRGEGKDADPQTR